LSAGARGPAGRGVRRTAAGRSGSSASAESPAASATAAAASSAAAGDTRDGAGAVTHHRFQSAPGIRITTASLEPHEAGRLADAIAALGRAPASTYAG
jgi:hypothetical protein